MRNLLLIHADFWRGELLAAIAANSPLDVTFRLAALVQLCLKGAA